jgi:hypothetical protein
MMPQVDACIGTEVLGPATHTDNGRRDCRRELEADEPSWTQSSVVVSNPTTGEVTGAGFVLDLHDVRSTDYTQDSTAAPMRSPPGASLVWVVTVWCAHFPSVALPRGKWRECPPATVVLVKVSVYQVSHNKHACDSSLSKHPLIRCIASPAGSGDTGEESFGWA